MTGIKLKNEDVIDLGFGPKLACQTEEQRQ
jgi:hypothetical protein